MWRRWQTRGKVFPTCRTPRLSLTSSSFTTADHPQSTSIHTLLWLVIAANFVKLELLGTKSSSFLLPSLARLALPGAKWEAVLGLQTWEGAVSEKSGSRLPGTLAPPAVRQAAGHPTRSTAECANGCSQEAWQGPGRQPRCGPDLAFSGCPPLLLTVAVGPCWARSSGSGLPFPR